MQVLKDLIQREGPPEDHSDEPERLVVDATSTIDIQYRLLCIVTAFELLSGQGSSFSPLHSTL